jgi:hypothetical protein
MRFWNALRRGAVTPVALTILSALAGCGGPSNGLPPLDQFGEVTSANLTGSSGCGQADVVDYDTACQIAADCMPIVTGAICAGTCTNPNAAINRRSSSAQYEKDIGGEAAACNAPPLGPTLCIANRCVLALPTSAAGATSGSGSSGDDGGGAPDPSILGPIVVAATSSSDDGSDTSGADDGSGADTSSGSSGDDSSSSGGESSGGGDHGSGAPRRSHGFHGPAKSRAGSRETVY